MTTTQGVILIILSSVLILSSAESLYTRACSKGDAPAECQKFCELCQTGCIPPGKTLATKTFMDVCDEEQQLKFDQEQKKYTKICEEYMDGLLKGTATEKDQPININIDKEVSNNNEHHSAHKGTNTIFDVSTINLSTVVNAISLVLITVGALVISNFRNEIAEYRKQEAARQHNDKIRQGNEEKSQEEVRKLWDALQHLEENFKRQIELIVSKQEEAALRNSAVGRESNVEQPLPSQHQQ